MEKGKVLVVVSDSDAERSIGKSLMEEGFYTLFARNEDTAVEVAKRDQPELVVVEVDSPDINGWKVCKTLKEKEETRDIGLLLISSNGDEDVKLKGFELGADDVLAKPYGIRELIARVKALSRRLKHTRTKIRVKDIEIDLQRQQVKKAGKPIKLTHIQFKLLCLLAANRGNIFSRQEILDTVWGSKEKGYVTDRNVDVHIKRLREKLGEAKYPSQYIETVHGMGYRFIS